VNEDRATRYHRLRRRTTLIETGLAAVLLLLLLATGSSAALRDWSSSLAGESPVLTVMVYVTLLVLVGEALLLPIAFYQGVTLERRYELSTQATSRWWLDQGKALVVGLPLVVLAAVTVWSFARWSPTYWWVLAAALFAVVLVGLAHLAPVTLLPLFSRCEPLHRPALVQRLVALAERAGTRVLGVFEWQVSHRTRKANAALAGLGRTRRILLSDTLLAGHSDDEIEVILAHELSHHVHHDIWSAMAAEAGVIVAGFFLADRVLDAAVGHFGLTGKSDVAGFPLLLLCTGAASLGLLPFANGLSRAHERRADRYALDMTGNVGAFESAMRRLATQNLAEERPSRLVEVVFASHPSIAARLEAARAWECSRTEAARAAMRGGGRVRSESR
jgi:STE24 endopeptidase